MPVHRNTSRNKKERLRVLVTPKLVEIYNIPRSSTSSTSGKPPVSYSPPPHPPPPSPFSSSSSSPPAYDDNRRPILMPSPHRPTAFPSVSEYPSHYPSTPQGSPGRPLPLSSIAPNSPVPPVTYPSSLSPHNHYSSSYYGSISSDTTLSSPFNYSQRSFGSDSIGSQNPSPATLPALSFSDDSPAPSAFLPLYDLNPNNFVEQPSAVGPLGEFLLDFPTQNSVPQEVFYHGDDFLSTYGPYGQSSSLRHAVDPPDAVLLGNTSTHHNWSSALFRHPHQGYP
ncbi:hypothetical protein BDZ89DRAFT_1062264 [Hymenopellis radicata]|nr:hypothetical protein BDZ89DRAFT_1062264 [Hymenopellis radicata]